MSDGRGRESHIDSPNLPALRVGSLSPPLWQTDISNHAGVIFWDAEFPCRPVIRPCFAPTPLTGFRYPSGRSRFFAAVERWLSRHESVASLL